jgi:hypothetical protein
VYEEKKSINETEMNCVTHDLALYGLPFGLAENEFQRRLKLAFFTHPFIVAFLDKLNERNEIYFGEAKS